MKLDWSQTLERVECRSGPEVLFSDTTDHWKNAVQRLMGFDEEKARGWVEAVVTSTEKSFAASSAAERIAAHPFAGRSGAGGGNRIASDDSSSVARLIATVGSASRTCTLY